MSNRSGTKTRQVQVVHLACRHATDPGLLYDGDQGLLGGFARLKEAREVAALAQLGNLEVQRAQTGIESALSIPVWAR